MLQTDDTMGFMILSQTFVTKYAFSHFSWKVFSSSTFRFLEDDDDDMIIE